MTSTRAVLSANPEYMHRVETLPKSSRPDEVARAYFFSDPHSCADELKQLVDVLVEQDGYQPGIDPAYFAGDLLLRGQKPVETLRLAMRLAAKGTGAVLGNNDLTVLAVLHAMGHPLPDELSTLAERCRGVPKDTERSRNWHAHVNSVAEELDGKLTPEELDWFCTRPLTIEIPGLIPNRDVLVVHAGFIPGIDLHQQDPYVLTNVRSLSEEDGELKPNRRYDGEPWAEVYDRVVEEECRRPAEGPLPAYVVRGHDARMGLRMSEHSTSLDSAGVFGPVPGQVDTAPHGVTDLEGAADLEGARGRFAALRISLGPEGVERKVFWVSAEKAYQV